MSRSVLGTCSDCARTIYIHARGRCAGCYTAWQRAQWGRPTAPRKAPSLKQRREFTRHAWVQGDEPTADAREVPEIVGAEVYALAEAEARRLYRGRHTGPLE